MTEAFRAEGTPAGHGEEMEEVLVEVFHEGQGLGPKVDFCFLKQVVFHLDRMTKPEVEITGDADGLQSRPESRQTRRRYAPPPPVSTHIYMPLAAWKVTFYFHFAVLLHQGGIFFPRLNMTFDKDVFVVSSQDFLGACC